ncbi:MAG TPA: hypothetical protein VKW06_01210 [Candidatus Angelobacter sp.]|nr:hypothetical protein [Candidatus Angelobacter sp.]
MKSRSCFTLILICLGMLGSAWARDIVVPAGTLMSCTLDEPKFSSATVNVGDPFLCYPRPMQQFGQSVFPRGAYMVGHLEAAKEPGHFVGKGYLKMSIDRLGLPSSDVPMTAKVISVAGYNVDKEGKVIGHGHATRDVVEWMLPPLWPWKILTLPARGPRPTLKGEVRVTLRVMDDFVVPGTNTPGWRRFGEPSGFRGSLSIPQPHAVPAVALTTTGATCGGTVSLTNASLTSGVLTTAQPAVAETLPVSAWPASVTLFVSYEGATFPASQYWRDQDQLVFVSDGDRNSVAMSMIDWAATAHLNAQRNVRVTLRSAPVNNGIQEIPAGASLAAVK